MNKEYLVSVSYICICNLLFTSQMSESIMSESNIINIARLTYVRLPKIINDFDVYCGFVNSSMWPVLPSLLSQRDVSKWERWTNV